MKYFITGGSGFIGTNLICRLLSQGHEVRDFSIDPPRNPDHRPFWGQGDILDADAVRRAVVDFAPDIVIHLAARTDCVENTTVEEGYRVNTDGTQNVLDAIRGCPSVRRAIITSSQFVAGPQRTPLADDDYFPITVYGQSKVITEQLTHAANLPCCWTLIRPTNIWGPWHSRYPKEFWRIAARGFYFHPGGKPVTRCYGYVGNIIWQMQRILELPEDAVRGQTFYVSDPAGDIYLWANAFCVALCGKKAPKVPRLLLFAAGLAGDVISAATGKKFHITTSRYRSMTTDYVPPMQKTIDMIGSGPHSLHDAIAETVSWLRTNGDGPKESASNKKPAT